MNVLGGSFFPPYLNATAVLQRRRQWHPLQYSCLGNPMDGGAWWVAVHGVAKSQTWLSDFTFTFHFHALEKEMATRSSVLAWRIPGMGDWWAAVYVVAQNQTQLMWRSSNSCSPYFQYLWSESESHSVMSNSLRPHGLYSPWNSPGQNTGVGSLSLLQGIFPTQGSNPDLPHCRWILYPLSHKGSPRILEWVAYPFSSRSSWPKNWTFVLLHGRQIIYQLGYQGSPNSFSISSLNYCFRISSLNYCFSIASLNYFRWLFPWLCLSLPVHSPY